MAMDFPSSPTIGAIYQAPGGPTYRWSGVLWEPLTGAAAVPSQARRNRLVNPSMQISQENGDTASASAAGGGWYTADQWMTAWSITGGAARVRRTRPGGFSNSDCVEIAIQTAAPSLAAANYLQHIQYVEGEQIKDFLWGTAQAKPAVLRFSFWSQFAGTYTACIRNFVGAGTVDRTFLAKFNSLASTWQEIVIPIPGDVTGTWATGAAYAMHVGVNLAAGSDYVGVEGWQAGHKIIASGTTNGAAQIGTFYATEFGLYLDPDATGKPPRFEAPDLETEYIRSQRYYQKHTNFLINSGWTAAGAAFYSSTPITPMMKVPTFGLLRATYANASGATFNVVTATICRLSAVMSTAAGGWADVDFSLSARA